MCNCTLSTNQPKKDISAVKMAAIPCWSIQWVFQTQHFSTDLVAVSTSVRWPGFLGLSPHRTTLQSREPLVSSTTNANSAQGS